MAKVLESVTGSDALTILRHLAEQDSRIADRIAEAAKEILGEVDVEREAEEVQMDLEFLDVEEVWDRAGSTRHGYVGTDDAAWQMLEEAIEPFEKELEKYTQLSMNREATLLCMGMLKGIYHFGKESDTAFKEWATDGPREFFYRILVGWKASTKRRTDHARMEKFLAKHCPDWAPRSSK